MVVIRLARGGSKKKPFYHIVVADKRAPRDGKRLEVLGFYNPVARVQEIKTKLNTERLAYWQGEGAQLSLRVAKLAKDYASENKAA